MAKGFISIHRQIEDNWVWFSEPFSKGQAWIDLLLLANHKENFIIKRGIRVIVKRGQIGWCVDTLAQRWKWSRGKVERFFLLLEKDNQIVRQKNNITTLLSIVNYDKYQQGDNPNNNTSSKANGQQTVNQTIKQTDTNNNDNKLNNENNENNDFEKSAKEFLSDNIFKEQFSMVNKLMLADTENRMIEFVRKLRAKENHQTQWTTKSSIIAYFKNSFNKMLREGKVNNNNAYYTNGVIELEKTIDYSKVTWDGN